MSIWTLYEKSSTLKTVQQGDKHVHCNHFLYFASVYLDQNIKIIINVFQC